MERGWKRRGRIDFLSPHTVSALLDFRSYVDNVREYQGMMVAGKVQKSATSNAILRALASAGISRVAPLKAALEQDGGLYTPFVRPDLPKELHPNSPSVPTLPPSPFPDVADARSEKGQESLICSAS